MLTRLGDYQNNLLHLQKPTGLVDLQPLQRIKQVYAKPVHLAGPSEYPEGLPVLDDGGHILPTVYCWWRRAWSRFIRRNVSPSNGCNGRARAVRRLALAPDPGWNPLDDWCMAIPQVQLFIGIAIINARIAWNSHEAFEEICRFCRQGSLVHGTCRCVHPSQAQWRRKLPRRPGAG